MKRPTHIDVAEFERRCRASIAETFAIADQAVANGDADASFVAAQKEFGEARIQFSLACARGDNAGHGRRAILAAGASAIGQTLGSLMINLTEEEREAIFGWAMDAMSAVLTGQSSRGATPVARGCVLSERERARLKALPRVPGGAS